MELNQINRKEFFNKWIAALRSRKYKRAEGVLRGSPVDDRSSTLGHCCLGVACDILNKEYGYGSWNGSNFNGSPGMPPIWVTEWMFANTIDPDVFAGNLAESNDSGRSFGKTAAVLERFAKKIEG